MLITEIHVIITAIFIKYTLNNAMVTQETKLVANKTRKRGNEKILRVWNHTKKTKLLSAKISK